MPASHRCPGVPSSHLGHSMWVSLWMKRSQDRFCSGFLPFSPATNFIPLFLHTHSFHFISPCDGASRVMGRHLCKSQIFNIEVTTYLLLRPGPVSDTSLLFLGQDHYIIYDTISMLCTNVGLRNWYICHFYETVHMLQILGNFINYGMLHSLLQDLFVYCAIWFARRFYALSI